ncbi:COP9 signalosome complex subunit 6b [Neolecta irregularis DAH-3]|uniref:COP9 signalosome complex subunit 6b n=1 Tax=Neolecta irregularis (strain DAH-3) TaxID=1198029 RepID=A0A1U7LR78_NEOID|nr:COP9 signalosome complex subunit 6b [Neolecta irregularis DAH-3]|eukprot:OLL25176.1 COP9 signalosome complex subunit 6b [Neolecta irregularis DAH-3]
MAPTHSSLSVTLHPLALLTLSDLISRSSLNKSSIFGVTLGTQNVRNITMEFAFEVELVPGAGVNLAFLQKRIDQYRQVYPTLEPTGYFLCSTSHSPPLELHNQLSNYLERPPLVVLLHSALPLRFSIFETEVTNTNRFIEVLWNYDTTEAERVTVASLINEGGEEGQVISQLLSSASAIQILQTRIRQFIHFLASPISHCPEYNQINRNLLSLISRLPVTAPTNELSQKERDGEIILFLAQVTKSVQELNEIADKFNTAFAPNQKGKGREIKEMSFGGREGRGAWENATGYMDKMRGLF